MILNFFTIMLFFSTCFAKELIFEANPGSAQAHGKVNCLVLCVGDDNSLPNIGKVVKEDLEFTDQIDVELRKSDTEVASKQIPKLFKSGISIYCLLKRLGNNIKLLVKDTASKKTILDKTVPVGEKLVACGNKISSLLLPTLTGEDGVTLSQLAYCELINPKNKVICVSNYNAKTKQVLVSMGAVNIVPCWHRAKPLLFYSQLTRRNTRLMAVDVNTRRHRVVCSFDGLNMQPSVSRDSKKVVLCLSRSGNSELYLYDEDYCRKRRKKIFRQLTKNGGTNVSPTLLENGDVIFCSDFRTGVPQIFHLNTKKNTIQQLTYGKYAAKPSYCEKTCTVAFVRPVNGVFQLFKVALNEDNTPGEEEQITFNRGDKHDPAWSKCGRYLAFSYRIKDFEGMRTPQIAVLNRFSSKIRVLTQGRSTKSFPSWR